MKRTITKMGACGEVYYGNRRLGNLAFSIRHHFGMVSEKKQKYAITIVEGGRFSILNHYHSKEHYELKIGKRRFGVLCKSTFDWFFFKPDGRKSYDITVEEVK